MTDDRCESIAAENESTIIDMHAPSVRSPVMHASKAEAGNWEWTGCESAEDALVQVSCGPMSM